MPDSGSKIESATGQVFRFLSSPEGKGHVSMIRSDCEGARPFLVVKFRVTDSIATRTD